MEESKSIMVGPWGVAGDYTWTTDHKDAVCIDMIIIRHGGAIDSLAFRTIDKNGGTNWSAKIGGPFGERTDKICFDYPGELLTSMEGIYGKFNKDSPVVVTMLKFITNRATYGPFGGQSGTPFSVPVIDGKIVGFFGRSGHFVDSIGVCLKHIESDNSVPCHLISGLNISTHASAAPDNIKHLSSGCLAPRWPSLYGGVGGRPWDDGVFHGIKGIVMCRNEDAIISISVEYEKYGESVFSVKHGGAGGKIQNKVKFLGYPDEYLASVHGFYGPVYGGSGFEVIKSLTFYTNKAKFGPIGDEIGNFFSSNAGGKVVGFLGRSGQFLDALGLHVEYASV